MENTSDSFMPRPLLFCLKSGRSVCYSVPDNIIKNEVNGLPVGRLDSAAFYGCDVQEVVLPNTLYGISYSAFHSSNIRTLTIPASVTYVNYWLALDCKNLETVTWNAPADIPDSAFSGDIRLRQVRLAEGMKKINYGAFAGCEKISSLKLPESLTSIEDQAFWGCKSLKKLYIPSSVNYISATAFENIPGLTLQGAKNSYASYYAKAQGIPFQSVGTAEKPMTSRPVVKAVKVNKNAVTCSLLRTVSGAREYEFYVLDEDARQSDRPYYNGKYIRKICSENPSATFYNLPKGNWKIACLVRFENDRKTAKWSNEVLVQIKQPPAEKPVIRKAEVKGRNVIITVKTEHPQTIKGYDCVLAERWQWHGPENKVYTIKNKKTSTITFKNVKPGTYYVGAHCFVRENIHSGPKVFGEWSVGKKLW